VANPTAWQAIFEVQVTLVKWFAEAPAMLGVRSSDHTGLGSVEASDDSRVVPAEPTALETREELAVGEVQLMVGAFEGPRRVVELPPLDGLPLVNRLRLVNGLRLPVGLRLVNELRLPNGLRLVDERVDRSVAPAPALSTRKVTPAAPATAYTRLRVIHHLSSSLP
jgi:hypothetical protein